MLDDFANPNSVTACRHKIKLRREIRQVYTPRTKSERCTYINLENRLERQTFSIRLDTISFSPDLLDYFTAVPIT